MNYKKYLESPQWMAKRQLYFNTYGKYCRACGKVDGVIHLHHMTYQRLGFEPLSDLIALCPECHRGAEKLHRQMGGGKDRRPATMTFIKQRRLSGRTRQKSSQGRTRRFGRRGV